MTAVRQPALELETEWLREYSRTYLPIEGAFTFPPAILRQCNTSLIDIRNVFRSGVVVFADKLDGPGAIWVVEGEDGDGRRITVEVVVVTETLSVALRRVYPYDGNDEEKSDDAA